MYSFLTDHLEPLARYIEDMQPGLVAVAAPELAKQLRTAPVQAASYVQDIHLGHHVEPWDRDLSVAVEP